ncbi:MAG TPA: hypothetical protein PKE29_04830 [Phycisphaerales bacterium]|nr:hypothetical protein [Phycisphaerales bacterium]
MKPHPKLRKTIKWGGAAVTVLLVVVWIGSGWCQAGYVGRGTLVGVSSGCACFHKAPASILGGITGSGWYCAGQPFDFEWWMSDERLRAARFVAVPLWWFVLPALSATVAAWRLDTLVRRRARLNLCSKCNYDRTGLSSAAVCPECGTGPAA